MIRKPIDAIEGVEKFSERAMRFVCITIELRVEIGVLFISLVVANKSKCGILHLIIDMIG